MMCCAVLCAQVPAAYASELVSSLLFHVEPCLSSLTPTQLTQMVWALKQLQHTPTEVRLRVAARISRYCHFVGNWECVDRRCSCLDLQPKYTSLF
jgi:hypothetical protein